MHLRVTRRTILGAAACSVLSSEAYGAKQPLQAGSLPTPTGKVILSVTGSIGERNDDEAAAFDLTMLEALGDDGFTTKTPWYAKPVYFEGVRMSRLMKAVGASGSIITAYALNDYITDIPMADFDKFGTLLAWKRDGAYMPIRDKGPLFIVYPFDASDELKAQRYYTRSAWQVAHLEVR